MEGMDANHVLALPLLPRRRGLQFDPNHDHLLRLDDWLWKLFLLLSKGRLRNHAGLANALAAQFFGTLSVPDAGNNLHSILHLSLAHLLLFHGVRRHEDRKPVQLHQVVGAHQTRRPGAFHLPGLGLRPRSLQNHTQTIFWRNTHDGSQQRSDVGVVFPLQSRSLVDLRGHDLCPQFPHHQPVLQKTRGDAVLQTRPGKGTHGSRLVHGILRVGERTLFTGKVRLQPNQCLLRAHPAYRIHLL
mmetsp:Transcript_17311/g.37941  ORF Transcript_17311/g.37941 Transcript_17311/m.37941 type:complete len:243 (-) Transcript_17311:2135-2863(-)